MTEHTRGPWHYTAFPSDSEVGDPLAVGSAAVPFIATVHDTGEDEVLAEENARLIAAAPELLEALELMIVAWEQLISNLKHGVVQDYQLVCTTAPIAARAAIDKAKGGGS